MSEENKIIPLPIAKNEDEFLAPEDDLINRRKELIAKLPQFRGEVTSKNQIRMLHKHTGVEAGTIFWVTLDNKAYVIAEATNKKVTIKALDETATISTGITIYEMNKAIVSKEPIFNWHDDNAVNDLRVRLFDYFNLDTGFSNTATEYYLLYGRDIHYVTIFKVNRNVEPMDFEIQFGEFEEVLMQIGDLISIDYNTSDDQVPNAEIWMRTKDSKAELLYMMPFDQGVVYL